MTREDVKRIDERMTEVINELNEQKRLMLEVHNGFNAKFSAIEEGIRSQCGKYLDPKENRSSWHREAAGQIAERVRSYSIKRLDLVDRICMLHADSQSRIKSYLIEWLESVVQFPKTSPLASSTEEILKGLEQGKKHRSNVTASQASAMLQTVEVMEAASRAYQLGSHLIDLRGSSLRQYFDQSVRELDVKTILQAMQEILQDKSRESAKEILIDVFKKIPDISETVLVSLSPIAKAITLATKLREKIKEIKPTYRKRGPDDDLFDFADLLEGEDEAARLLVEQIAAYSEFLTPNASSENEAN